MFDGANVLLTGGGGSVGRALLARFLSTDLNVLRVLDNDETGLARLRTELDDDRVRYLSGDIREKDRLLRAMKGVDLVVHTAAMKHVDICEYNPFEAVKTNVVGLQNVVDAAIDSGVERFVYTSSDKAVNPANTMGTTKLLGEKLVTAGNKYAGRSDLRLASVRFGNVVDSSQSVVPLFREQIRTGGPVTLTDERMRRFFLSYDQVGDLVTGALEHAEGGEVFIHKMPAVRIDDLAAAMIDALAPEYGHDPDDIEIEVVGRRLGETLHEEIMTEHERDRAVESDRLYAVLPETRDEFMSHPGIDGFEPASGIRRSTAEAEPLAPDEVRSLLNDNGVLGVTA